MSRNHPAVVGFLERADALMSGRYAAVLHGSIVRGDYLPGRSDVNLLIVADEISPAVLRGLSEALTRFEAEQMGPPLIIPRAEWERAADVFPIEITDVRGSYELLRGADPLAGLEVRPADLQRALESELRGKLLRLRLDYGLYHTDDEQLGAVVGHSIGAVRVLLRTTLALAGTPVHGNDDALARAVAGLTGGDAGSLTRLLVHRRDPSWRCPAPVFESYIGIVEQATRFVDHFHSGDH
jgi:hypothetical protein